MLIFRKRLLLDRLETVRRYYRSPKFALLDCTYGLFALFSNPYRACRKHNQKLGEKEIHTYGETPFSTYEKIAKLANLKKNDVWVELGSGRGKGCFWLAHFIGCQVIGVERVPQLIRLSRWIKSLFSMKNTVFFEQDIEKISLEKATFVYLYGLWPKLKLPKGIKVITTGEPMPGLIILDSTWVRFPWGRTRAFLQEKV